MTRLSPNLRLAILWVVIAVLALFRWYLGDVTLFEVAFGVGLAACLFILMLPTVLKHRRPST
jgi:hypothetical protein